MHQETTGQTQERNASVPVVVSRQFGGFKSIVMNGHSKEGTSYPQKYAQPLKSRSSISEASFE